MRQKQYNRDLAAGISTAPPRRNMVGRFGKSLLLVFVLATAVIAGRTMTLVVSGKTFGTGISRDQAIALARSYDADAGTLVAARVGRLREFEGDGACRGTAMILSGRSSFATAPIRYRRVARHFPPDNDERARHPQARCL